MSMAKSNKKKKNKSVKSTTNTKKHVDKVELLDDKVLDEEDIFETRQQEFDFGDLDLTSTLDTSFTSKKGSNKVKDESEKKFDYIEENIVITKNNIGIIWLLIGIIFLLVGFIIFHFATFNHHKVKVVTKVKEKLVVDKNYLFLGDSITDYYNLDEYYNGKPVVNSGICGNTTTDILNNMDGRVYKYNPSKVFLLIGTNDLQKGKDNKEIVSNIEEIIKDIKRNRPSAKIYLESIYPVDEERSSSQDRKNSDIKDINKKLKQYCCDNDIKYIDLYSKLVDKDGINLEDKYSKDGLHLNSKGYEVVTSCLKKYID